MSDFFEQEAEVDSAEDTSNLSITGSEGSDGEVQKKKVKTKKKKKLKKKAIVGSDDDDDDEDGEDLDGDLEDLIDDNPVEEEEEEGEEGEGEKRKHDDSELEEDLEDDDYDLIEENLGIKVNRKQKRKRIRVMSEDEESPGEEGEGEVEDRDVIAREIFEDGDEEGEVESLPDVTGTPATASQESLQVGDLDAEEGEEESDVDDFIVDDDGQPIQKAKKKKTYRGDSQLQEALDVFGVDFDYDEFEDYGDDYDEDDEIEEDQYEEDEEGEEGEARPRPKKTAKRKTKGTSIYKVFEPDELTRGFFTDVDQEIRTADTPERFQLRGIQVCPTEEGELEEEAEWIFKHAFVTEPLSQQEYHEQEGGGAAAAGHRGTSRFTRGDPSPVSKIRDALNFMRNQQFEVPFIAFYRKEYVEPELNINDLWKIYQWDEKWMQLRTRKTNLVRLFEKMQQYQFDQIEPDKPLPSHVRTLTEEDIDRARGVQTMEELHDVYHHFLLYYGLDLPKMKAALKAKRRREREAAGEEGEEREDEPEEDDHETLKQASRKTGYTLCIQAGMAEIARKFGLTPEQFGENLRDNYQRHEVEQDPELAATLAEELVCEQFPTPDDVLKGARHVVAMQVANDPLVRQTLRQVMLERAKITLKATKKGMKEIDEGHTCYVFKYLINKPVKELSNDQYLKVTQAEEEGLVTYEIHMDDKDSKLSPYFDEILPLYQRDEFSNLVQEWNRERGLVVERALNLILYPQLVKEIRSKLLEEAKEHVVKSCSRKLYNWLKVAPYQADQQLEDEDEEYDSSRGLRAMGIGFSTNWEEAAFGAMVDGDGEVTDHVRLPNLLKRKNAWRADDREAKENDLEKLRDFILSKKPHVVGVLAESRDAIMVMEDVKAVVAELEQEHQIIPINVELVDTELAVLYSNCKKAENDFRDYPSLLRQAISVARRLQDPLVEFAQLCNPDEDILCLKYHTLQDAIAKETLLNALHLEFINRVNEVGVDVNRCVTHSHTSSIVQFVCGLGPRKGYHLLKILKQNNSRLENRTQLVTMCSMGPKVFINCAGFIKIDTTALGDSTEAYVEVLDGSRVHPETYEWARKMAVDALEYDDTAEGANPAGALEEILESPERLRELDLDAFAMELENQGYGNKHITLYDIRAELNHRYKDLRTPFRSPTMEERFNMLTKESPQTFYIGKLIMCRVTGIAHKRPHGDQLDNANPVRDDQTGLWKCPFCQKDDFPELSEVWQHFDAGECAGQPVGVKTRLDNSIGGFIPLKFLSDKRVTHPEERVQTGMTLHGRISKIDIERFQVEITSRTSDLVDKEAKWKLQKDPYYDYKLEEADIKREEDKKKNQARQTYVKRVIAHPSFHNIDYKTCEKLMNNMEQGEVIIRPSSKGTDRLTATWKVTDGCLQHIDVREEGKENAFSLGNSLWIGNEEFEDLDEIIARHVQPMAAFARDILGYKYFKDAEGGKRESLEKLIIEDKKKAPSRIPYYFSCSHQHQGKFLLSYLPRKTPRHEYVTVTPDGLRYRSQVFTSLNALVRWFKEHFRDPIPGTPSMRTPMMGVGSTPSLSNIGHVDNAVLQRAAAGLGGVLQSLQGGGHVTGNTPFGGYSNFQPVATPLMTPMVTPAQQHSMVTPAGRMATPAQHPMRTPQHPSMATPQYQPTPRSSWGTGGSSHATGGSSHAPSSATSRTHPGGSTPRTHPGSMTPRLHPGGSTPRTHPGSMTPSSSSFGRRSPRSSSAASSSSSRAPSTSTGTVNSSHDWAKIAENWARQRQAEQRDGPGRSPRQRRTPRSDRSPARSGSTPAGDATPLFDER